MNDLLLYVYPDYHILPILKTKIFLRILKTIWDSTKSCKLKYQMNNILLKITYEEQIPVSKHKFEAVLQLC